MLIRALHIVFVTEIAAPVAGAAASGTCWVTTLNLVRSLRVSLYFWLAFIAWTNHKAWYQTMENDVVVLPLLR